MQISDLAYMGVESLARLAAHDAESPCSVKRLAAWINRSISDTEAFMARLLTAGLVKAGCGPDVGYYLARPADRITVAQIFDVFDEPQGLPRRPLNAVTLAPAQIETLQGTDLLWEALRSYILLFLNGISVADIAPARDVSFAEEDDAPAPTVVLH
jgi:Rrf2 family protein